MVTTGIDALKLCVELLGSQQAAADACGVRQQSISECLRVGKKVPAEWCIPLEKATKDKNPDRFVPRSWLRPDLYPEEDEPPRAKRRPSRRRGRNSRMAGAAA